LGDRELEAGLARRQRGGQGFDLVGGLQADRANPTRHAEDHREEGGVLPHRAPDAGAEAQRHPADLQGACQLDQGGHVVGAVDPQVRHLEGAVGLARQIREQLGEVPPQAGAAEGELAAEGLVSPDGGRRGALLHPAGWAALKRVGLEPGPGARASKTGVSLGLQGQARARPPGEVEPDGHLLHRALREGHTDGVAKSVLQEGADADGALQARVVSVPGFGHPQVKGVVHPLLLHAGHHESVGLDHDLGVGRLHGDDQVAVVVLLADTDELERALHHALGGVAVAVHDPVREGAVVGADAHGDAQLLGPQDQGRESLADPLELSRVLLVGVVALLEPLGVGEVPRVDADLIHVLNREQRQLGGEVDVGDQGHPDSPGTHPLSDLRERLGILQGGDGDPHDLAPRRVERFDLREGRLCVPGERGGHGLDADRLVAAHPQATHTHHARSTPRRAQSIRHVAEVSQGPATRQRELAHTASGRTL
jgi:hypothetical protein